MSGEYRIQRQPYGWWGFYHASRLLFQCPDEELATFHQLSGDILRCSDENCPCHEAGRQKELEAPREPQWGRA